VLALDPGNAAAERLLAGSARRLQMTLMFCDLVGSTQLADRLDPEDLTEILRGYRTACTEAVERYGGFIEDRQGDGLLVRFGYPRVHEDDARRAVLAGLEIVRRLGGLGLQARIAVHTGVVVVDAGDVIGAAPNEVARLQATAEPGVVLISEETHALAGGYFEVAPRGPVELRGVSRPIMTYDVRHERVSARLEAASSLTPFTGRRDECAAIAALWEEALAGGSPPAVLVSGGAGIGKSRLLLDATRTLGAPCRVCQCSGYHQTTSLHAFRRVLEQSFGIAAGDGPETRLARLRALAGDEDLPLLGAALSIPAELLTPPPEVDPSMLRVRALHVAAGIIAATPSLLQVEDLHWADESTLDLLGVLLSVPRPGVLTVLTARDDFEPPWPVRRVPLGPLPAGELEAMAREIPESAGLPEYELQDLMSRSDGVPLFLEELARGANTGARELPAGMRRPDPRLPAALRDPLLARLASPGVDLDLVQIASTIGRDVDRGLLQRVAGLSDETFGAKLANLLASGLLDRTGERTVRFRHELIRVVAYETQRRSACRERHSRIADLLPAVAVPASDAGVAAFHLERAERYPEAIAAHIDAARAGQALGAHKEVTQGLTHVLTLVERLPEGPGRLVSEFTVRQLRSFSAVMSGGYSSPESREDHARCVELCEALGLGPELMPSLWFGWTYYCSCDLAQAERVCETLERVAAGMDVPARELGRGVDAFFRGRLAEGCALMRAFLAHPWALNGRPPAGWPLPNDPFVSVSAHLAAALWLTGDPDAARAVADRALDRLAELEFPYGPFSAAYLHSHLALIKRLEGDHEGALMHAREMKAAGERHGFALFIVGGVIHEGLSRIRAGDPVVLDELVESVAQWRELLAAEVWSAYFLTELAIAEAYAGRRTAAYESLREALAVATATGAEFYSAEALRVRGELRWEDGDEGGLDDLRAAVETARRQGATALESRALASLRAAEALTTP
jgi:class 3 adenylate cyclase